VKVHLVVSGNHIVVVDETHNYELDSSSDKSLLGITPMSELNVCLYKQIKEASCKFLLTRCLFFLPDVVKMWANGGSYNGNP